MGPSASVLLRHCLTEEQLIGLEQWLHSITSSTSSLEGRRGKWRPFWIKDVSLIGLLNDGRPACAFGLEIEKTKTERDFLKKDGSIDKDIQAELREEREQLVQHLGFFPEQRIDVDAGCNRPLDHRILGQLVLLLAERYGGIIDLLGAFYPPTKPGEVYVPIEDKTIEAVEQYVKELSLPGRVFHMYSIYGDTIWISHLIDPDFLRAWLQHPHFYMIK